MVNFGKTIANIRIQRDLLVKSDKYPITSEYCYQLVSLLMESEKIINGGFFSVEYIEEKTKRLLILAEGIRKEEWYGRGEMHWNDDSDFALTWIGEKLGG